MYSKSVFSRVAAISLTLLIIGIFCAIFLVPIFSERTKTQIMRTTLEQEINDLRARSVSLNQQFSGVGQANVEQYLWKAKQAGEMTAKIQAELGKLATQEGISLRSIIPTVSKDFSQIETTGLRIEAEADLSQFKDFILTLEQHEPALFIERAILRRINRPGISSEQPLIFFQIDILAPVKIGDEE